MFTDFNDEYDAAIDDPVFDDDDFMPPRAMGPVLPAAPRPRPKRSLSLSASASASGASASASGSKYSSKDLHDSLNRFRKYSPVCSFLIQLAITIHLVFLIQGTLLMLLVQVVLLIQVMLLVQVVLLDRAEANLQPCAQWRQMMKSSRHGLRL